MGGGPPYHFAAVLGGWLVSGPGGVTFVADVHHRFPPVPVSLDQQAAAGGVLIGAPARPVAGKPATLDSVDATVFTPPSAAIGETFLVQVFAHHHDRGKFAFRNDRCEFESRNREQENVNGSAQGFQHLLFRQAKFTDVTAGRPGRFEVVRHVIEHVDEIAVDTRSDRNQVVSMLLAVGVL